MSPDFDVVKVRFPEGFCWGASTAAYQNEGGNIHSALWDWERKRGWERSADATRSWELFDEDLRLLRELKLNAYRFSVEWSRVEPEPGRFDESALSRYADWARRLLESGIRPLVCLHHFSEPAWLLRGHPRGWLEDEVRRRFLRFVEKTAGALAGSVSDWLVFNEPMVFLLFAYAAGRFPPGLRLLGRPERGFLPVLVENLARSHNESHALIHRLQPGARVGVAHHVSRLEPARPGDEGAVSVWDRFMHRAFLDRVKDRLDFLGINYYTRIYVSRCLLPGIFQGVLPGYAEVEAGLTRPLFRLLGGRRGDRPRTGTDWEIAPEGLAAVVLDLWREYRKPIWVSENGLADAPGASREDFLRSHLQSLSSAMAQGADVRGYLHWSLLDNYEWGSYRPRFGLYDRERRPKPGAALYARIAEQNGFDA